MLKLKYLFDNRNLATMILGNWEYDTSSLGLFDYYRISSNAIYPFKNNDKVRLLRFSPQAEKDRNNLIGELEFIHYLKMKEYPALCTVAAKNGEKLLEVSTPWGNYYAVVFERVSGGQLSEIDYTEEISRKHGKYLGKLHKLSSKYKPSERLRWSYEDVLMWIEEGLSNFPDETLAKEEVKIVKECLSTIPKGEETFGLIHYDFELDNVFYDQATDTMNVIDFDDVMYHWYAMDMEQALNSIMDETSPENHYMLKDSFIEGYREEFNISDEMLAFMPTFRRFANLYGYYRILLSAAEVWDNEPEWMQNLRGKLTEAMKRRSVFFGKSI